jgi:polysaccharide export outer membrane protein
MRRFTTLAAMLVAVVSASAANLATAADVPAPDASAAAEALSEYKLGPGDKLHVTTYGEETLTGDFSVGSSGKVALPLIGDVQAAGLTIPQLQKSIETALIDGGYLKQPRINIEVLNYRPFYILGEVEKPGEYPYVAGLTVMSAVATANGFTYRANTKRVVIKHANSPTDTEVPLTSTLLVSPGDTIRVKERYF